MLHPWQEEVQEYLYRLWQRGEEVYGERPGGDWRLADSIREALWGRDDLLHPKFRHLADVHPLAGHCYVATEVYWHLMQCGWWGDLSSGVFYPHRVKVQGITHWYLAPKDGGFPIIDITAEQFEDEDVPVPYAQGRRAGFLTKHPSKRAQRVMDIVNAKRYSGVNYQQVQPSIATTGRFLAYNTNTYSIGQAATQKKTYLISTTI